MASSRSRRGEIPYKDKDVAAWSVKDNGQQELRYKKPMSAAIQLQQPPASTYAICAPRMEWVGSVGLHSRPDGTPSLRRTKKCAALRARRIESVFLARNGHRISHRGRP